ncbi:comm domain containing protein [Anaeramoeba flamelloides]|uniref:Comm domain containing protein n=1 Tax=Anaeramoeba flamelloides TaxID=1746091 RepID=A0AAV8A2Z2_9EUKA|nr:comm domain containing protein [Anaeramoeba flamelloides]
MVIIYFNNEQKEDLQFLQELSFEVGSKIVQVSIDFFQGNYNPKLLQNVSTKLNLPQLKVERCVYALSYLFTESSKLSLSKSDFLESVNAISPTKEIEECLLESYQKNCEEMRRILSEMSLKLPSIDSLQWRLDVQISSRRTSNEAKPVYLLKLKTSDNRTVWFQADYNELESMTNQLEIALKESKSQHYKRIKKYIK